MAEKTSIIEKIRRDSEGKEIYLIPEEDRDDYLDALYEAMSGSDSREKRYEFMVRMFGKAEANRAFGK